MTDTAEFEAEMARQGIKKKDLAAALDLTPAGLWKKINNITEFTAREIKIIQIYMSLSDARRDVLFFK